MSSTKKRSSRPKPKRSARDIELGREIATLRKAIARTQEDVATDLRLSVTQYAKYERGETPMKVTVYEDIKACLEPSTRGTSSQGFSEEGVSPYLPPGKRGDTGLLGRIAEVRRAVEDLERYAEGG